MPGPVLCRTCGKRNSRINAKNLFVNNKDILCKIHALTGIWLTSSFDLPNCICAFCQLKLDDAIEFRDRCIKSDNYFRRKELKRQLSKQSSIKLEHNSNHDENNPTKTNLNTQKVLKTVNCNESDAASNQSQDSHSDHSVPPSSKQNTTFEPQDDSRLSDLIEDNTLTDIDFVVCETVNGTLESPVEETPSEVWEVNSEKDNKHIQETYLVVPASASPLTYVCELCKKSFKTKQLLNQHASTHTGEHKFRCEICHINFTRKSSLQTHYSTKSHKKVAIHKLKKFLKHKGLKKQESIVEQDTTEGARNRFPRKSSPHTSVPQSPQQDATFETQDTIDGESSDEIHFEMCETENVNGDQSSDDETSSHISQIEAERDYIPNRQKKHGLYLETAAKRPHACQLCSESFTTKNLLDRHAVVHTDEQTYCCELCDVRYSRKTSLQSHIKSKSHKRQVDLERTKLKKQEDHNFDDSEEDNSIDNKLDHVNYNETKADNNQSINHEESFLDRSVSQSPQEDAAFETQDDDSVSQSSQGHATFKSEDDDILIELLNEKKLFESSFEATDPANKIDDRKPVVSKRARKRKIADENKLFVRASGRRPFQQNIKTDYICHKCGRCFNDGPNLKLHVARHGEKNYKCDECDYRTYSTHLVTVHKRIKHLGEKRYPCKYCGERFLFSSARTRHQKGHKEWKPDEPSKPKRHACDLCSRSFKAKKDLQRHALVHTGEQPFSCDICPAKFKRKSSLTIHYNSKAHKKRS